MSILKNYLITMSRNFIRDIFFSAINLTGLAIGLTSAFLIFLFIQDELSYDEHFDNHERIYRVESLFTLNSKEDKFAITQVPLAPTLKDEFPEIEEIVRMMPTGQSIFVKGEEKFEEDSIIYADSTIFNIFSHDILHGNANTALTEPNTMAISSSMAVKYFGRTDILDETIETNTQDLYRVTAVFRDLPWNTHMRYNGIISTETIAKQVGAERFNDRSAASFWNVNVISYIKLKPGTEMQGIFNKFPAFYDKYMREVGDKISANFEIMATPLSKIHYNPIELQWDKPKGNKSYLLILGFTGAFIIIIAGINYMNLSTARATRRAKEVGMRKVSGASKSLLMRQFFTESIMIAFVAMIFAALLVMLFLPLFNEISGKHFTYSIFTNSGILLAFIALTIITGLISGIYPALYLSSFNPIKILKGIAISDKKGAGFRKALVVLQFAISVFLIIGSIVVSRQLRFMSNKELGFDKENLIVVSLRDTVIRRNFEAFKQEVLKIPSIVSAGGASSYPGQNTSKQVMRVEGEGGKLEDRAFNLFFVDFDYLLTMNIKLDTGRSFSREMGSDPEKSFIINHSLVEEMHWLYNPLGKKMHFGINLDGTAEREGEIIGVLKDFHYGPLHNPIDPIVIMISTNPMFMNHLILRTSGSNKKETIEAIRKVKEAFGTNFPFQYFYLDEKLNELYKEEAIIDKIFKVFTLLTLFIAALGLLGLSAFVTQQRTREIGIRKVMGASGQVILTMFLKEFSKWVIISNIIAIPVAYLIMTKWLEDFYYRIEITWTVFFIAFLISIITAIITVTYQCIRAATLNPAESLKYE